MSEFIDWEKEKYFDQEPRIDCCPDCNKNFLDFDDSIIPASRRHGTHHYLLALKCHDCGYHGLAYATPEKVIEFDDLQKQSLGMLKKDYIKVADPALRTQEFTTLLTKFGLLAADE